MTLRGFLMTREMAFAHARDEANRSMSLHQLLPWTDEAHEVFCRALRDVWTLDDEAVQNRFVARFGRVPSPVNDDDYQACLAIAKEFKDAGISYGPIPS